jgi:cytochrome d ubiquinol oxidase subunit I
MRVSEAVTNISSGPIWTSFAIVVVIYALVVWAFVGILLRMKIRWRHEDADLTGAGRSAAGIPPQPSHQQQQEVEP